MLAPLSRKEAKEQAVQMATALAAIMLDQDLVAALRTCSTAPTFKEVLGQQMECITIVPHSHSWPTAQAADDAMPRSIVTPPPESRHGKTHGNAPLTLEMTGGLASPGHVSLSHAMTSQLWPPSRSMLQIRLRRNGR